MRHLIPSPSVLLAFAALLAACGGIAVAATSSGQVIRACANKKTGALRLASKCRRSERSVSWNKEGVPGPRGVTGATGAPGAVGAAGANRRHEGNRHHVGARHRRATGPRGDIVLHDAPRRDQLCHAA
jgi:hypothetical protein